eukprot:m51a1_g8002 hypothetical protein (771) ;mRNA; r:153003-156327
MPRTLQFKPAHSPGLCSFAWRPDGKAFYTAAELSAESLALAQLLLRAPLAPRHLAYSNTGSSVACAVEDGTVRIVSTVAPGAPVVCKGHRGAVLSVACDPQGKYVASAGADGEVRVFDAATAAAVYTLALPRAPPADIALDAPQLLRLACGPDAPPRSPPPEVHVVARETWAEAFKLQSHAREVSLVTWSRSGGYAATASVDGMLLVWDVASRESIHSARAGPGLCDLAWNPAGNSVAVMNTQGQVAFWDDVIPPKLPNPSRLTKGSAAAAPAAPTVAEIFGNDDAGDGGDGGAGDAYGAATEGEEEEEEGERRGRRERARGRRHRDDAADFAIETAAQGPFQPSASPVGTKRRFFAYNHVGAVVMREEDDQQTITVEFTDQTAYKRLTLADHYRCSIGSLCESGLALASSTTVLFRPLVRQGPAQAAEVPACDWVQTLPAGEAVVAVVAGAAAVCVVTSRRLVRLFSLAGVERELFVLPGDVVAAAARGPAVALAYHAAPPADGSQNMAYLLVDVAGPAARTLASGPLALTRRSLLSWLGLGDDLTLYAYDSSGVLSALLWARGCSAPLWCPVLDLAAARKAGETQWMVGVAAGDATFIVCKDGQATPPVVPLPLASTAPLTVPLIAGSASRDFVRHNEAHTRGQLLLEHRRSAPLGAGGGVAEGEDAAREEALVDVSGIRMAQAELAETGAQQQAQRDTRVLDICATLRLRKSLMVAVKEATAAGCGRLAEAINALLEEREDGGAAASRKRAEPPQQLTAASLKRPRY